LLHIGYSAAIMFIIFLMTNFNSKMEADFEIAKNELAAIKDIRMQGAQVHDSMYIGTGDLSRSKGNIFQAITFLVTHRNRYPTYLEILNEMAKTT